MGCVISWAHSSTRNNLLGASRAQGEGTGRKGSQDTIPLQSYGEEETPRKESS